MYINFYDYHPYNGAIFFKQIQMPKISADMAYLC